MYYVLCKNNEYLVVNKELNIISRFYSFEEAREMSMFLNFQEISYNSFKAYASVFLETNLIDVNGYNLNSSENLNQNFIYNNGFLKQLPINNSSMERFNYINQPNQNMNFLNGVENFNQQENFNKVLNNNNFVEKRPVAKKIVDNNFDSNFGKKVTRNSVKENSNFERELFDGDFKERISENQALETEKKVTRNSIKENSNLERELVDGDLNKKNLKNQNLKGEKKPEMEDLIFGDNTLSFNPNEKSLMNEEKASHENDDEYSEDKDFTISTSEIASFLKKIKM